MRPDGAIFPQGGTPPGEKKDEPYLERDCLVGMCERFWTLPHSNFIFHNSTI